MWFLTLALAAVVTAACDGKDSAGERNFSAAIRKDLETNGRACLGFKKWPVDVPTNRFSDREAARMTAMEKSGLVSGHDAEVDAGVTANLFGGKHKNKVKRYELTDVGKAFVSQSGSSKGDVCYGMKTLAKIVKWEGPLKLGDYQEASVKYLYGIAGMAEWAKSDEMRKAFPNHARFIDGAGTTESQIQLKLTSDGWEKKHGFFDGPVMGF